MAKKRSSPNSGWKEVKLSGNLITDDSVGTLEGFIGLEVLENYDKNLVLKSKPQKKKPGKRKLQGSDKSSGYGSDQEQNQNRKKKKNDKSKKRTKQEDEKEESDTEYDPGCFVRIRPGTETVTAENKSEDEELEGLEDWQQFGLHELLLKAIKDNGFKKPTEIQKLTLPSAIMGMRDILGAAETGSGKTLAFGLPILNGILKLQESFKHNSKAKLRNISKLKLFRNQEENLTPLNEEVSNDDTPSDSKPLYTLILTPTRELAVQVRDHLKSAAKFTDIKVAAIFGGLAVVKQERLLKGCPEIVVATPGRLWELIKEGNEHLSKIDDIHFLVIDETDRMVEKGHFEELKLLMERLNRNDFKKAHRQNFIFSATLTLVHDIPDYLKIKNISRRKKFESVSVDQKIKDLINGLGISQPKVVDITQKQGTAETLTECRIVCSINEKDYYLYYFLQKHPGRTIVFCNSIDCVRRLNNIFSILGCHPLPLHANMIQKQRLKNLERFKEKADSLLVATDVAARGLDIPKIDHVIHYQVPRTSENYVHRSGRTARANREGIAVLIMEPAEAKNYDKLCKTLNRSEDLPIFPVDFRLLNPVKDRVNLAREVDALDLKLRKEKSEIGWLEKTAEEMDIVLSDVEDEREESEYSRKREMDKDTKLLNAKRNELAGLIQNPIFPKGFSFKYPTASGQLNIPIMGIKQDAISVMKTAIKENNLLKGTLFKKIKNKKPQKKNKNISTDDKST